MSNIFYSLMVGMMFLINPVHANDETNPAEDREQTLSREVYTPIFVEFRTNHDSCEGEGHEPRKEFDGLLFHIDDDKKQPVPVNPYLNLNNESLVQKFWEMALVDTILFSNVNKKE